MTSGSVKSSLNDEKDGGESVFAEGKSKEIKNVHSNDITEGMIFIHDGECRCVGHFCFGSNFHPEELNEHTDNQEEEQGS